MGFRRNQKENKYITEIDLDELEFKTASQPTEQVSEPDLNEAITEEPLESFDAFDIPIAASPVKETVSEMITDIPREPLAEKEIEMVKDLRTNQTGTIQMKVARPKNLREATAVADSLIAGQTIVLNLDALPDGDARRMIDYIAGVIFAIHGKIERPADRTFLLTPNGVNVATEEKTSDSDEE